MRLARRGAVRGAELGSWGALGRAGRAMGHAKLDYCTVRRPKERCSSKTSEPGHPISVGLTDDAHTSAEFTKPEKNSG